MSDHDQSDDPSPPSIRDELVQQLATLAGPGAVNCGLATETGSADEVYRRAAAALAAHQPFYCMYLQSNPVRSPEKIDAYPPAAPMWPWCAGYVGKADGGVFEVRETASGRLVRGPDVLGPHAASSPRRLSLGVTSPVLLSSPTVALDGAAASITGVVIVEAVIGIDGSITKTRVLKPLPLGISELAARLVQQCTFQPSRLFEVMIPVFHNVIVEARAGRLSVR